MIEVIGDLWTYPADVRIITTNGSINSKGECVMGRGCAREAKERYPWLPKALAAKIKKEGNHPYAFEFPEHYIDVPQDDPNEAFPRPGRQSFRQATVVTFPVKHQWFERADLNLIRTSTLQLVKMLDPDKVYVMPRPGCGNGKRDWQEVRPLLTCLPDNVHVITWPAASSQRPASLPTAA